MDKHVSKICSIAYYHLHNIRCRSMFLTKSTICSIIHALITNRIDYCNSLLANAPAYLITKLQRVQNSAARLILNLQKFDHVTPAFLELHWLPVRFRIKFKFLLLIYKAIHGYAPSYLTHNLTIINSTIYCLMSNHTNHLSVPKCKCPSLLWNSLPSSIRQITPLSRYKSGLKTYLYAAFLSEV